MILLEGLTYSPTFWSLRWCRRMNGENFKQTKGSVYHNPVSELRAAEKDIFRYSPEWIPVVYEP